MMFLFRAAFWIAVVAAFAPAALTGAQAHEGDDRSLEQVIAAGQDVMQFCADMPAVCEAGREAGVLLGGLTDATAEGVNRWLEAQAEAGSEHDAESGA